MTEYTYDANLRMVVPIVDHGPEKAEPHKVVAPVVHAAAIPAQTLPPVGFNPSALVRPPVSDDN